MNAARRNARPASGKQRPALGLATWLGRLIFALGCVLSALATARAAGDGALSRLTDTLPPVTLSTMENGAPPFGHAVFLRDPEHRYTIADVASATGWERLTIARRNQGISGASFFLAFRLENDSDATRDVVVSFDIPHMSIFTVASFSPDGMHTSRTLNPETPVAERPAGYGGPAVTLTLPAGESRDVVVMMRNAFAIPLHIGVQLFTERGFIDHTVAITAFYAFWIAALLVTGVFWLVSGTVMWRRRLIFYALYLVATAYTYANFFGIGYQLIYPDMPWLQRLGFHWSMFLMVAAALEFARRHLEIPRLHPVSDRFLRIIVWLCVVAAAIAVLRPTPFVEAPITYFALTLGAFYIAWLSCRAWQRDGLAYAKWMTFGWFAVSLTCGLDIFGSVFDLPLHWSQVQYVRATYIMVVVESMALGVSLAQWLRGLDVRRVAAETAAAHDDLTGLLNRRGFMERLVRLEKSGRWPGDMWLVAIDIDRFKSINDRHTHTAGDAVLVQLSQLLSEGCRPHEFAARFGGEEFMLLFEAPSREAAYGVVNQLRQRFANSPTMFGGTCIFHSFSAGLVRPAGPDRVEPLEDLLTRADEALYAAKRAGRNRVSLGGEAD